MYKIINYLKGWNQFIKIKKVVENYSLILHKNN